MLLDDDARPLSRLEALQNSNRRDVVKAVPAIAVDSPRFEPDFENVRMH
jgi:hypothetical protein